MQFAKNRIERLKVMGFKNIARYLASFYIFNRISKLMKIL